LLGGHFDSYFAAETSSSKRFHLLVAGLKSFGCETGKMSGGIAWRCPLLLPARRTFATYKGQGRASRQAVAGKSFVSVGRSRALSLGEP